MTITFKEFAQVIELTDEEFNALQEGLSDVPGFGWLKNIGNDPAKKRAALAKIDAERKRLQKMKTAKAKELDAALAAFAAGTKPQAKGVQSNDVWDQALGSDDRKFNAKMDRARDANTAHRERNLGMAR